LLKVLCSRCFAQGALLKVLCSITITPLSPCPHLWGQHVDEGIAHVALVLEVNGQVEEVKGAFELLFNGLWATPAAQHSTARHARQHSTPSETNS
jgi:hypothetical protein